MSGANQTPAIVPARSVAAEIAAGMGLGLLVGVLLGLSVEKVVGEVISALTVLIGAFFGLAPSGGPDRAWRIGSFGLACAIAVVGGLLFRTGNAPGVSDEVKAWTSAGADTKSAVAFVAYERLGIKPADSTILPAPPPTSGQRVLFASTTDLCGKLGGQSAPAARLQILHDAHAPYDAIAAGAEAAADPGAALAAAVKSLCGF